MILIPCIKFPSNCDECPCENDGVCKAKSINRGDDNYIDYNKMSKSRMPWCPLLRIKGGEKVNAKQALKLASKHIVELEDFNIRSSADIKNLYSCCLSVIAEAKTFCDWCEERNECQRECKGKGCEEWWMDQSLQEKTMNEKTEGGDGQDGGTGEGEIILSASPAGGEGT